MFVKYVKKQIDIKTKILGHTTNSILHLYIYSSIHLYIYLHILYIFRYNFLYIYTFILQEYIYKFLHDVEGKSQDLFGLVCESIF